MILLLKSSTSNTMNDLKHSVHYFILSKKGQISFLASMDLFCFVEVYKLGEKENSIFE